MVICLVTIWIWKDSIKDPITSEKSSLLYKIFLVDFDNGLVHLKVRCGSSSTCLSITVAVEEHLFLSFAFERSIKRPSPFLPPFGARTHFGINPLARPYRVTQLNLTQKSSWFLIKNSLDFSF